jgi:hypothetical protein
MVLSNGGPPEALISVMRVMAERNPQDPKPDGHEDHLT